MLLLLHDQHVLLLLLGCCTCGLVGNRVGGLRVGGPDSQGSAEQCQYQAAGGDVLQPLARCLGWAPDLVLTRPWHHPQHKPGIRSQLGLGRRWKSSDARLEGPSQPLQRAALASAQRRRSVRCWMMCDYVALLNECWRGGCRMAGRQARNQDTTEPAFPPLLVRVTG